eukprot:Rmarinus@m.16501
MPRLRQATKDEKTWTPPTTHSIPLSPHALTGSVESDFVLSLLKVISEIGGEEHPRCQSVSVIVGINAISRAIERGKPVRVVMFNRDVTPTPVTRHILSMASRKNIHCISVSESSSSSASLQSMHTSATSDHTPATSSTSALPAQAKLRSALRVRTASAIALTYNDKDKESWESLQKLIAPLVAFSS